MSKPFRPKAAAAPQAAISDLLQRGLELHQSGRLADAARVYEQVLRLDAVQPAANHLLGVVRLGEGKVDDAVRLIERAVAADGANAQYLGNLGVAFSALDRHKEALEALRRAVALNPDFAEAYTNMGTALRGLGRFDEAADAHRQAIRLKPAQPGFHYNLGNSLEDAGLLHEAESSYHKAIRLNPDHAGAMSARSRVLQALRRYEEALGQARTAAARKPNDPDALMALGGALRHTGNLAEASSVYRRLLEKQPDHGEAYYLLSYMARHSSRDSSFSEMERIFRNVSLPRNDRTRAGFALGKALADVGDHAESVEIYRAANALRRLDVPFSASEAIAEMQDMLRNFADVGSREFDGYGGYDPLFIVGLPRAGKTTLEQALGKHPAMRGVGELTQFRRLVLDLGPSENRRPAKVRPSELSDAQWRHLGERYSDYARMLAPAGRRTIDTMPPNFLLIGFIRAALPNARIIHCVRDPLSQCVNIFEKIFGRGGYGYSYNLAELARYYGAYRRMMAQWSELYPDRIFEVDVADLRQEPALLSSLLDFCGLEQEIDSSSLADSEPQLGLATPDLVEQRRGGQLDAYRPMLEPLLLEALPKAALSLSTGPSGRKR